MEIATTMVKFLYPKKAMEKKTERAQLFLSREAEGFIKVWVPLKKLHITENGDCNEVIMPKWVFFKSELPCMVSHFDEFIVTTEIQF